MWRTAESLSHTPETNVALYINYISIKKVTKEKICNSPLQLFWGRKEEKQKKKKIKKYFK